MIETNPTQNNFKNNIFDVLPKESLNFARQFYSLPSSCVDNFNYAGHSLQLNAYLWKEVFNLSETYFKNKSIDFILNGLKQISKLGRLTEIDGWGTITFPDPKGLNYNLLYCTWLKLPYQAKVDKRVRDFMKSKIEDWNSTSMFKYFDYTIIKGYAFNNPEYSYSSYYDYNKKLRMSSYDGEWIKNFTQDQESFLRELIKKEEEEEEKRELIKKEEEEKKRALQIVLITCLISVAILGIISLSVFY